MAEKQYYGELLHSHPQTGTGPLLSDTIVNDDNVLIEDTSSGNHYLFNGTDHVPSGNPTIVGDYNDTYDYYYNKSNHTLTGIGQLLNATTVNDDYVLIEDASGGNHYSFKGTDYVPSGNPTIVGDYYDTFDYYGKEFTEFVYEAFDFERPIYLYIWGTLVIITFLVNILVVWVLLHKTMRSVTNLILVAIAISDSFTGLVTLPSYFMVYTVTNRGVGDTEYFLVETDYSNTSYMYDNQSVNYTWGLDNYTSPDITLEYRDAHILSKSLCQGFMISKFFLSKSFHTISIWLTLFLGIQRYISVAYPFKTKFWFTARNTLIICVTIALLAPVLHIYHLVNEKAVFGFCVWQLVQGSVGDAVYLWTTVLLRHTLPCAALTVTTVLFVIHLKRNAFNDGSSTSSRVFSGKVARGDDNRRISIIVIAIVIVFLIPEVPFAIYLTFTTVVRHMNADHLNDQKRNRAFDASYDIAVVVSFQLNFYIYTFFNRKFRQQLKKKCPCLYRHVRSQNRTSTGSTQLLSDSGRRITS